MTHFQKISTLKFFEILKIWCFLTGCHMSICSEPIWANFQVMTTTNGFFGINKCCLTTWTSSYLDISSYKFITNAHMTPRQKTPNFQNFKKFQNFQNWNFLKMRHTHMKLVSSLFRLEKWSSSPHASKLSRVFKFDMYMSVRALPRTLRALLSTPFK